MKETAHSSTRSYTCLHVLTHILVRIWMSRQVCMPIQQVDPSNPHDVTHWYVVHDSFVRVTWLDRMGHVGSFICETWLIRMWDMTHWYVAHDSFVRVTWLDRMGDVGSFTCETWLIRMWDMTHLYVRHDSFIRETWLMHTGNMAHSYVWRLLIHVYMCSCIHSEVMSLWHMRRDSFSCATWLIPICDVNHSHMRRDSFPYATWLRHIYDMQLILCQIHTNTQ